MSQHIRLSRYRRLPFTPSNVALIVTAYLLFVAILFGAFTTLAAPERDDLQPQLANDSGLVVYDPPPGH